jgi:hypothetical protein
LPEQDWLIVWLCRIALASWLHYRGRFDHPKRVGFYMDDEGGEPDIIDVMKENAYFFDVNNKLANE